MTHRLPLAVALAVSLLSPAARGGEEQTVPPPNAPPPRRADFFAAHAVDARVVRVVPLERGRLPDLTQGVELRPEWPEGVDLRRPPGLAILPDGDLLVVGHGTWLRYRRAPGREDWSVLARGEWPTGVGLVGAADVDADGHVDLVLLAARERTQPWRVLVARGDAEGAFAFRAPLQQVAPATWAGNFAIGDADDDGRPDLLFQLQPHGADVPVMLQLASGRGDCTFAPAKLLARGPLGASTIAVARLAGEARHTIVLGCDDDTPDVGQAQEVVRTDDGGWLLRPSVDLEPDREEWASDEGHWALLPTDLDLDGYTDLVARWDAWYAPQSRQTIIKVLRGKRDGWRPAEPLIDGHFPLDAAPALAFPPAP